MRSAITAALFAGFMGSACAATEVDLDRPGAMEALQRDRPEHHRKISEAIAKAQTIHVEPAPTTQNAATGTDDPRRRGASSLMLSDPAKKRLVVPLDDMVYRVTAHLVKDPGKVEKAR